MSDPLRDKSIAKAALLTAEAYRRNPAPESELQLRKWRARLDDQTILLCHSDLADVASDTHGRIAALCSDGHLALLENSTAGYSVVSEFSLPLSDPVSVEVGGEGCHMLFGSCTEVTEDRWLTVRFVENEQCLVALRRMAGSGSVVVLNLGNCTYTAGTARTARDHATQHLYGAAFDASCTHVALSTLENTRIYTVDALMKGGTPDEQMGSVAALSIGDAGWLLRDNGHRLHPVGSYRSMYALGSIP